MVFNQARTRTLIEQCNATMEQKKPESDKVPFVIYAHQKAIELASKMADPIMNRKLFEHHYLIIMGGYGFFPYP